MDEPTFWRLIEDSKRDSDPTSLDASKGQPAILQRKLETLPAEEIESFDRIFRTLHARAYRWDLWAAAYVIQGGCSDDGFIDFRSGLIGLGRDAYYDALRDPETLARQPTRGVVFSQEELAYAARFAYEAVCGEEMLEDLDDGIDEPDKPIGERFDRRTLADRFPLLTAKFAEH